MKRAVIYHRINKNPLLGALHWDIGYNTLAKTPKDEANSVIGGSYKYAEINDLS